MKKVLGCLLFTLGSPLLAAQADLEKVLSDWQLKSSQFAAEFAKADDKKREELLLTKPDPLAQGRLIWNEIKGNLQQGWSVDGVCWLLQRPAVMEAMWQKAADREKIYNAIFDTWEHRMINDPAMQNSIATLIKINHPRSRPILEKLRGINPDQRIKGLASLGLAMLLRGAGHEAEVVRQRLAYLKDAIIYSNDLKLDDIAVKDLVKEELYIINNLLPGRLAQEFSLKNRQDGSMQSLQQLQGKVVVLFFADSSNDFANQQAEVCAKLCSKAPAGKLEMLWIDSAQQQGYKPVKSAICKQLDDSKLSTHQLYRVHQPPFIYIIDQNGKIVLGSQPNPAVEFTLQQALKDQS